MRLSSPSLKNVRLNKDSNVYKARVHDGQATYTTQQYIEGTLYGRKDQPKAFIVGFVKHLRKQALDARITRVGLSALFARVKVQSVFKRKRIQMQVQSDAIGPT